MLVSVTLLAVFLAACGGGDEPEPTIEYNTENQPYDYGTQDYNHGYDTYGYEEPEPYIPEHTTSNPEYEPPYEHIPEDTGVVEPVVHSALFQGLYFTITETFELETITAVTQNHFTQTVRDDPTVVHLRDYHMGHQVLFVPVTITTIERSGDLDYRFRPEIRRWSPSGQRTMYIADTLNERTVFQHVTVNEISNYEWAVINGYIPFAWEGPGEYRLSIIWQNEIGATFSFNVDANHVVYNEFSSTQGGQQQDADANQNENDTSQSENDASQNDEYSITPADQTLVGEWQLLGFTQFIFEADGRGTMGSGDLYLGEELGLDTDFDVGLETDILWWTIDNVLIICSTPEICDFMSCMAPTEWYYVLDGDLLTLTSTMMTEFTIEYIRR